MPTRQLFIIRIALITGVAAFAAMVAYQRAQHPALGTGLPVPMELLRYALWGLCAAAVGAALFLRTRMGSAPAQRRGAYLVVGWAFGEGVALFGSVQHYLGAARSTMMLGLVAFFTVLMLLPVPRDQA
jgi:FtsH-binding integral membrane protein